MPNSLKNFTISFSLNKISNGNISKSTNRILNEIIFNQSNTKSIYHLQTNPKRQACISFGEASPTRHQLKLVINH